MLNKITKSLSSIAFKLFISFWLFAILSIALTRVISTQLAEESVLMPLHKKDIHRLKYLKKRIERSETITVNRLLAKNLPLRGEAILLKDPATTKVFANKNRFLNPLIPYLETNSFDSPASIQFANARITGPLNTTIANTNYQLYIAVKGDNPHFSSYVMQLPKWARIIIPVIVSMLLAWLLARSLSRPLVKIKHAAAKIGNGQLTTRVDHNTTKRIDELGDLSRSFNQMAEKLEQNITAHQRLLGDVSHELRSPMTRLQMAIGLALQSIDNKETLITHLSRCELEVTRLDDMIAEVLSLSRLENTIQHLSLQTCDLSSLLNACITDGQYLANNKSITINAKVPKAVTIQADGKLLASAITNVLINAVKYSPANSTINVFTLLSDKDITIQVVDSGPGVPEESINQLFQPFYRVEHARDRDTGGTGLGLAIAHQAILAHNGNIFAQNNESNGLTVTLVLPR
ncbi:ATP-binding protein [Thalassotalea piscium]|uniref:histidine kinase n=1 Tax=Thalassotalea piscium TaxID=1230533 RepID=A0A7X0NJ44_9GAMM|nr:ATP-binding protein [Thalassotalea piscium]MBB6544413.1 two-component system sensor histidine kinase CpxA [Thalassotalea piscium]